MSQETSTFKKSILAFIVLFVVGYGLFNSRFIIQGPEITLEQVEEGTNSIISPEKTLFLKGKVFHSSFITINGRPIFIDETGQFNEKLLLSSGVSIIDIYAKDKFGKEVRKKIDVLYQGETPLVDYGDIALAATVASTTDSNTETVETATQAKVVSTTSQETVLMSTQQVEATSTPER
jgi:hypothetical protein